MRRGRPEKPESQRTSGARRKGKNRDAVAGLTDELTTDKPAKPQSESGEKKRAPKARVVGASAKQHVGGLVALISREITVASVDDKGKVRRRVLLSRETRRRVLAAAADPLQVEDLRALVVLEVALAQAMFEQGLLEAKDLMRVIHRAKTGFAAVLQLQHVGGLDALLQTSFAAEAKSAADVPGREVTQRAEPTEVGDLLQVADG